MDQTVASSRDTGLAGAVDPERVVMGETATSGLKVLSFSSEWLSLLC